MQQRASPGRAQLRSPLLVAVLLIGYGNLTAWLSQGAPGTVPASLLLPNLVATAALLLWARKGTGLRWHELGLRRHGAARSALYGTGAALLISAPLVLSLLFPWLPFSVSSATYASLTTCQLLWRLLVELPFSTALCEELAFRGVLQALLLRRLPVAPTVAITNLAFALWHGVINLVTVEGSSLSQTGLATPALIAAMAGVLAGGVIFSLLRLWSKNLAGSVVCHWLVDALLTLAVYAKG